jgi:hypothetical protein
VQIRSEDVVSSSDSDSDRDSRGVYEKYRNEFDRGRESESSVSDEEKLEVENLGLIATEVEDDEFDQEEGVDEEEEEEEEGEVEDVATSDVSEYYIVNEEEDSRNFQVEKYTLPRDSASDLPLPIATFAEPSAPPLPPLLQATFARPPAPPASPAMLNKAAARGIATASTPPAVPTTPPPLPTVTVLGVAVANDKFSRPKLGKTLNKLFNFSSRSKLSGGGDESSTQSSSR